MTNLPPPPPSPGGPGGYQQQGYGYSYGAVPVEAAGFWMRFAAYLIDGTVLNMPVFIVVLALPDVAILVRLIGFAASVAYYAVLEGGETGQTLGKKALSIRVVDQDTWQPGIGGGRGIGRFFSRWLSIIPLGLGYLWMLWDKDKQTFHDKLARTRVVKTG
jgi:uncharacterized RDD family membrane protein YckC